MQIHGTRLVVARRRCGPSRSFPSSRSRRPPRSRRRRCASTATAPSDVDRVKIPVDDPADANPGPPADVGAGDFTIEFWMRAAAADNTTPGVSCGANAAWVDGNVVVDRDRAGADRKFGVSIAGGSRRLRRQRRRHGRPHDLQRAQRARRPVAPRRRRAAALGRLDVALRRRRPRGRRPTAPTATSPIRTTRPRRIRTIRSSSSAPRSTTRAPPTTDSSTRSASPSALRYTSVFTRPKSPFTTDADTAALYHLDEGAGLVVGDSSGASGGPSDGTLVIGGSPAGPEWTGDAAPLGGAPSVVLTALPGSVSGPMQVANAHDGSNAPLRRGTGGHDPDLQERRAARDAVPRHPHDRAVLRRAGAALRGVPSGLRVQRVLLRLLHQQDRQPRRHHDRAVQRVGQSRRRRPGFGADPARRAAPDQLEPQRRAALLRPATATSTPAPATAAAAAIVPNNAQNLDVLLGKLLRIDVNGTGAVPCGQVDPTPYAIPPSNPFVGDAGDCDEIWAYGLRNPWRYSFDRVTGDLLDRRRRPGALRGDRLPAGREHRRRELRLAQDGRASTATTRRSNCDDGTLTLPILEQPHTTGWCAIIGGMRYRGTVIPALDGTYLYSDNCLGDIYSGTQAGDGSWTTALLKANGFNVSGFGEDEAGEVYFADLGGNKVYRIDPSPSPSPVAVNVVPPSVIAGDPGFNLTSTVRDSSTGRSCAGTARTGRPRCVSALPGPGGDLCRGHRGGRHGVGHGVHAGSGRRHLVAPDRRRSTRRSSTFPISNFAYQYIQAVFDAGVTAGCGPRLYCPDASTTRAQMAVFLLKAGQGSAYVAAGLHRNRLQRRAVHGRVVRPMDRRPCGSRDHRRMPGQPASLLPGRDGHAGPDGGLPLEGEPGAGLRAAGLHRDGFQRRAVHGRAVRPVD